MATATVSPAVSGLNAPPSDVNVEPTPVQKSFTEDAVSNEEMVSNALELGSMLVELKGRIQVALLEKSHFPMRLVSIWRALFNRVACLQHKAFPDCTTAETLYQPPGKDVLPYLYPDSPDYANIGIPAGMDNSGGTLFENFKLYDVTRRAINCLSLLYVDPASSLIPDVTEQYQQRLIADILDAAKQPGAGGGSLANLEDSSQLREEAELNFSLFHPEADDRKKAMVLLTERVVKFLNAWDGYLRENYYVYGHLPNDETELIAYEAGRSLGILSWGLTLNTLSVDQRNSSDEAAIQEAYRQAWKETFRDTFVNRLQQQISALSAFLDGCFTKRNEALPGSKDKAANNIDPQRPRHIIDAIKNSLEYWRLTIQLITGEKNREIQVRNEDGKYWKKLRLALIEQTDIWQLLLTGKQDLRSYNVERVTQKIMQDITTEMQARLQKDFKGSLHQAQAAVKEITAEVSEAAKDGINTMYQSVKSILLPAGIVIGVMLLVVLAATFFNLGRGGTAVGAGSAGIIGLVTTALGFFNLRKEKSTQENLIQKKQDDAQLKTAAPPAGKTPEAEGASDNGFLSQLKGAAQQAGEFVIEAFHRAMDQIKVELTHVKYSASVSYPLIEVFAMTYDVKSDEKFITEVIFNQRNRNEEIGRVVSAAFGPLSVFIGLTEHEKETGNKAG